MAISESENQRQVDEQREAYREGGLPAQIRVFIAQEEERFANYDARRGPQKPGRGVIDVYIPEFGNKDAGK